MTTASSSPSTAIPRAIDPIDIEILMLITKGNPSSYSIWSAMNKELQGEGLAYINIKKRIRRLIGIEYLQETKPDTTTASIRGRRDYKITMKCIEFLIPYMISQSQDLEPLSKYIYKSGLDRKVFEEKFKSKIFNMFHSANSYYKITGQVATLSSEYITNIKIGEIKEPKPIVTMVAAAADNDSKTKKQKR
jgi:hypothetical protein